MIIILREDVTPSQKEAIIDNLVSRGFDIHRSTGLKWTILGVVGDAASLDLDEVKSMEGVAKVLRVSDTD